MNNSILITHCGKTSDIRTNETYVFVYGTMNNCVETLYFTMQNDKTKIRFNKKTFFINYIYEYKEEEMFQESLKEIYDFIPINLIVQVQKHFHKFLNEAKIYTIFYEMKGKTIEY